MKIWFQKKLYGTFAWMFYCKFAGDFQDTFSEERLCGTGSGFYIIFLVEEMNNTFSWLAFKVYWPEFVDWSKTFLKVVFILYIFRNIFLNASCNWSTFYIFISIFSQTNNCRSSPPQVFFKKDHLIYTSYKCKEENLHK